MQIRLSKSTYLIIASILFLSFWGIKPITTFLNRDIILMMSLIWAILGFYLQWKKQNLFRISFKNYHWIWILIFLGIFISMNNAYIFWNQSLSTTFIAQRFEYTFILLPAIFFIQPSIQDIIKTLRIISYITLTIWIISIIMPNIIGISKEVIERRSSETSTDIGYYVKGFHFVVLYTYFLIQKYIQKFKLKSFLIASCWILLIILYQNRSLIIGIIVAFVYSLTKLKSNHKPIVITCIGILCIIFLVETQEIWYSLIEETESQLNDQEYNRWKALNYYLFDYSPNLWCYIFGNGMPSGGNSELGNLYWFNMERGIFTSDLGMIGMWVHYGIIPLIGIYYIIFKTLFNKSIPLWLKFMSFHILIIPTIFEFSSGTGILLFTFIIYLYIFFKNQVSIKRKLNITQRYARHNYSKL